MRTLVLATRNAGKIKELEALLSRLDGMEGVRVVGLAEFPQIGEIAETGSTFAENALLKARACAEASGEIALADDSGLEVDALNGAPGIYSARYSLEEGQAAPENVDAANNAKLLAAMAQVPDDRRTARFRCVIAACAPNGNYLLAEGAWEGTIARELRGSNGFGYDSLFIDPASGLHSAELAPAEKNQRSHRAAALAELARQWPEFLRKIG